MPYVNIHTHEPALQEDTISVVNVFPWDAGEPEPSGNLFFTAGIHPWFIEGVDVDENIKKIVMWLEKGKLFGVGEAGLDAVRGAKPEVQEEVFVKHINLSEEYERPLVIHCVKAYNEILSLRKSCGASQPWLLHGFNSSPQMMKQMTDAGIFISLGAGLLKNKKLQQVCREVPAGMLFFENDVSGTDIKTIYRKAAVVINVNIEELKDLVYKNFIKIKK